MSEEYYRILGVDYGSVRIGLALSDPLRIIAQGMKTIANDAQALTEICNIITEQEVKKIVVGMPFNLKGEISSKGEEVNQFIKSLQEKTSVPIERYDERFTSVMAQRSIKDMGSTRKQRKDKGKVDEVASAILLQNYLDFQKSRR